MPSLTAAAFIVALKAQLVTRLGADPAFDSVRVFLVPPKDQTTRDAFVLVADRITGTQAYAALGRHRRDDGVTIPGFADGWAAGPDTDDTFQRSIDRASALVDELVLELRDNFPQVGDQTLKAAVTDVGFLPAPLPDEGGWLTRADFTITYTSRVS